MDVRVLLEGVERVKVVMKLPSAKLASVAGMTRWSDISYGCCATSGGSCISA
jgi:hypothetical protein